MKGDRELERVTLPGGATMVLKRWGRHVAISVDGRPLMRSHEHASEDELGRLVAAKLEGVAAPRVLIGGLGLGYTLRAALDALPAKARVVVAELVPEVVAWQRGALGKLAKHPLDDKRVKVVIDDVGVVIKDNPVTSARAGGFHAILLDVDNGPDALVHPDNARLYKRAGLARTRTALREGGFLAVWSAFPSKTFTLWLESVGFTVQMTRTTPSKPGAPRYYIWWARRTG